MSKTKLRECPFCGGEAKYISFTQGLFVQRFVTCTKCGIETRRNYLNGAKAIEAWNTRKPIDDIVERLEEKSYDSMHLDMSTPMTETWQIIDLKDSIDIVRNAGKDGAE